MISSAQFDPGPAIQCLILLAVGGCTNAQRDMVEKNEIQYGTHYAGNMMAVGSTEKSLSIAYMKFFDYFQFSMDNHILKISESSMIKIDFLELSTLHRY